jgi:transposase-like protein
MESVHVGAIVNTSVERAQLPAIPKKQRRSIAEKRWIVEETQAAGASVARVARAHGVNPNQVFQWWRLYRAGRSGRHAGGGETAARHS